MSEDVPGRPRPATARAPRRRRTSIFFLLGIMYMNTIGNSAIMTWEEGGRKRERPQHCSAPWSRPQRGATAAHHGVEDDGLDAPGCRDFEKGDLRPRGDCDAVRLGVGQLLGRQGCGRAREGGVGRRTRVDSGMGESVGESERE